MTDTTSMTNVTAPAEPAARDPADDLTRLAERVDEAIAATSALEPSARDASLALKAAIETFHKAGLTAIVKKLKADPRGKELLFELVDDPTVHALLTLHGIVRSKPVTEPPVPPEPMELVQIQLPAVSGNGHAKPAGAELGWVRGPAADAIEGDRPVAFEAGNASVIVIRSRAGLRAFRNACAHQGLPLERGVCDPDAGTITCPWHGFQFDSESGECFSAPQCQLEPFPLRITDGFVWVRPS